MSATQTQTQYSGLSNGANGNANGSAVGSGAQGHSRQSSLNKSSPQKTNPTTTVDQESMIKALKEFKQEILQAVGNIGGLPQFAQAAPNAPEPGRPQTADAADDNVNGEDSGALFGTRVILSHRVNGTCKKVAQEICTLSCGFQTRKDLMEEIKRNFDALDKDHNENKKLAGEPNRCLWGDKYVAESMEINWKPSNPNVDNGWAGGHERENDLNVITDFNLGTSLAVLKNNASCALNVLVSKVPGLFEPADVDN